ncbi:hypothetical protein JRO89_XS09G0229700 [Xanthoceras sorbifolium]|uniref:Uncharacterized protein n=1 Tax=Xanthoceras sorbifolium TaxID=99658 RepID=A0ABQ8HMN4_9ROSI|nr:hypothetical protein JRO89_XS09G0229700 [Xanthoceras sorbifolium]
MANFCTQNSSSQRGVAMVLALVSAVVLSPLYNVTRKNHHYYYDQRKLLIGNYSYCYSSFVLPLVLGGLIIAIKTTSSSSSSMAMQGARRGGRDSLIPSLDEPSWVLRIGSSSWGLAGVLLMLLLVLSWQDSVQHFFWR